MNYIEQINVFWLLDAEHLFNGNESRLYFYLLKLSNSLYWKNPLTNADGYTAGMVGISVNTLKTCRNRLQQAGLIAFKPGGNGSRDKCIYELIEADKVIARCQNLIPNQQPNQYPNVQPNLQPNPRKTDDINKHKPNHTKPNNSKSHSGATAPAKKKKGKKEETPVEHWAQLVECWFVFNESKFKERPSFAGADPRHLRNIVELLKSRAAKKGVEWTAENATARLQHFLESAYQDDWLPKNFLLKNLESQFDKVILEQKAKATAPRHIAPAEPAGLPKLAIEINYLYARFLEDESKVTIRSLEAVHYDFLKRSGKMELSEDLVAVVKDQAMQHNPECEINEQLQTRFMKLFAILELFKVFRSQNIQEVFHEQE